MKFTGTADTASMLVRIDARIAELERQGPLVAAHAEGAPGVVEQIRAVLDAALKEAGRLQDEAGLTRVVTGNGVEALIDKGVFDPFRNLNLDAEAHARKLKAVRELRENIASMAGTFQVEDAKLLDRWEAALGDPGYEFPPNKKLVKG